MCILAGKSTAPLPLLARGAIASKTLTVTDPNSQRVDCDIEFMVQGEEHLINDTVKVTLSSPDAEKFAVRWGRAYYYYYDSYSYYDDDDYYDNDDDDDDDDYYDDDDDDDDDDWL